MRNVLRIYGVLLVAAMILAVTGTAAADNSDKEFPNIDYLVGVARMTSNWTTPPMGGPQQRYIKDISTGKTYLVEVGYWTEARILAEF
ncbi:MAG: hypothetical protein RDU20_01520 [Desulfomonilaceae bacterium]|nr:hypothetical protein [Desulfomonilaceae bacterium]